MVGKPEILACADGTKFTCNAGTLGCYADSPSYCKAPAPKPVPPVAPKPSPSQLREIQCGLGTEMCHAGDLLCFDFSPQRCPSETDAFDAWMSPKPFAEVGGRWPQRSGLPAPNPCAQRMCATLGQADDVASCLCYAQAGPAAPEYCQGVGSGSSAAQSSGAAAYTTCMSVM